MVDNSNSQETDNSSETTPEQAAEIEAGKVKAQRLQAVTALAARISGTPLLSERGNEENIKVFMTPDRFLVSVVDLSRTVGFTKTEKPSFGGTKGSLKFKNTPIEGLVLTASCYISEPKIKVTVTPRVAALLKQLENDPASVSELLK